MSYDIYKIKGSELIDEKARTKIADIKNVAKSGSYKDLDLTGATINKYDLPKSTDTVLGGVKVGEGLKIDNHGRLGQAHTIDLSLHKTSIQLTKDRHQIIDVVDGDTIILPTIVDEELLIIDVKIEIPWNAEHKSPSVTFPMNIKWVESPRLKFDSWYDYTFIYANGEWLGSFVEYDVVYDSSMNMFVMDTSMTSGDKTVKLQKDRAGDTTNWDGITDWGDGTLDTETIHTYDNDGIYLIKTKYKLEISGNYGNSNNTKPKMIDCLNVNKHITNLSNLFGNTSVTNIDLSQLNTSEVTDMSNMFSRCSKLQNIFGLENFNTTNVTNMGGMFSGCNKLTTLDISNFDTSKVTNMVNMFRDCSSLTTLDVSNFDTSKVTNMASMFNNCNKLTTLDVSNFDTAKVTNMNSMFSGCSSLTTLDVSNFDTTNVTNMNSMFWNCTSLTTLDVSNFNTTNVTNMASMFNNCNKLTTLDVSNFDTAKVKDKGMEALFRSCGSLTTLNISNFDTSNVTNMNNMFNNCNKLTTLDISNFNMDKVTAYTDMFISCTSLHQSGLTMTNCNEATKTKINSMVQP